MPAKTKHNPRKTSHNRERWGQRLNGRTAQTDAPRVVRKVMLPNGHSAAIAEVNGVFLVARFDQNDQPLQARPDVYAGSSGQGRAFSAVSALAGRTIQPGRWR